MSTHASANENSFLDRLDARIKLPLLLGLVILVFAASNWMSLVLITIGFLVVSTMAQVSMRDIFQAWWSLRWLLLFTLLMHLLFSPGYTLFGLSWLSRDGLVHGLFVVAQLCLAVCGALLLSRTTPIEILADTFGWFLLPFKKLGCPVDDWRRQLLLTLKFMPIVREEYLAIQRADLMGSEQRPGYVKKWFMKTIRLIDRLLVRADTLACEIVAGKEQLADCREWPTFRLFSINNGMVILGALLLVMFYLMAQ